MKQADILTPADLQWLADAVAERLVERMVNQPKLLNYAELAERLGVSQPHVERLAQDGKIPKVQIGRRVAFNYEDVVAALSSNKKTPTS